MNIDGMGSAPPPGVKKGSCWEDWREEGIDLRWTGILTIILFTPSAVDTSWAWHCFATKPNCHFPPAKASDRNKKYLQHCTLWCLFCFGFVLLFSLFHNFFFFLLHYITLRRRSLITYCKLHTFVTYLLDSSLYLYYLPHYCITPLTSLISSHTTWLFFTPRLFTTHYRVVFVLFRRKTRKRRWHLHLFPFYRYFAAVLISHFVMLHTLRSVNC